MNGVRAILANELRRVGRDRTGLFFILVLPVVIITVIGATFGASPDELPVGIIDRDGSARSRELVAALDSSPAIEIEDFSDERTLRQEIRTQTLSGGIVIPEGFGRSAEAGEDVTLVLLSQQAQGSTPALLSAAQSVADDQGERLAAARFATEEVGGGFEDNLNRADELAAAQQAVSVDARAVGRDRFSGGGNFSYPAASNLVLFVFINSLAVGAQFVEARQFGVVARILAAPVSAGAVVVGTAASRYVFAILQSLLIVGVGALVFGVDWGDPAAGLALILVYSGVGAGTGMLVGSIVRNPEQAYAIAVPVAIGLGMLGGCMWPLSIVGPTMRAIGHLTPQAWAMDGWIGVIYDGDGVSAILPQLAVLAAMAVGVLTLATLHLRRVLQG